MLKKERPAAPEHIERSGRYLSWIVFIAALSIRLVPFSHVFYSGKTYLYDPDCYIRLHKIHVYLQSFPSFSVYDYFEGFPVGTGVISPPTMEYIIAALVYPFRHLGQLSPFLEIFVALIPPVAGAITAVMVGQWVLRHMGVFPAVAASAVLVFYPPFIDATVLGRFDNEMLEPLLLVAVVRLYLGTYEKEAPAFRWYAAGLMHAFFLTIWRGAVFPLSIIGVDLLARIFAVRRDPEAAAGLAKNAALMYIFAAAPIALICGTDIWGTRNTFGFNIVSWFHVGVFLGAAASMLLFGFLVVGRQANKAKNLPLIYASLIVFLTCVAVFITGNAIQGIKVLGGGNAWIDSINQYQRGMSAGKLLRFYGGFSFIAPFVLLLLGSKYFQGTGWRRFMVIWTLLIATATLSRVRFAEYYALNVSILAGVSVFYAGALVRDKGGRVEKTIQIAAIGLILLLQGPAFRYLSGLYDSGPSFSIKGDVEDTMLWLRDNTPPAGNPYRPFIKPAYGILSRWDYGGWLEYIAQRPTVATNFGTETYGMEEAARFFLSVNEDEMNAVLARNKVRYIIVDKVLGDIPMYAKLIGRRQSFYEERWDPKLGKTSYIPRREALSLIVSRLFFADGSMMKNRDLEFKPVEGVRLVYESPSPARVYGLPWEIKKMKVFEYNPGALVIVKGPPGQSVILSQNIETNQGRRFTYMNEKFFGNDGTAGFRVAYQLKKSLSETGATGPVVITGIGKKREITVTDEDVESHKTIEVKF